MARRRVGKHRPAAPMIPTVRRGVRRVSITKGIPEGERISLQKAVTWAFYGWSLAGDLSRKEIEELDRLADYPAPGSIYHSLPELRQDSKKGFLAEVRTSFQ